MESATSGSRERETTRSVAHLLNNPAAVLRVKYDVDEVNSSGLVHLKALLASLAKTLKLSFSSVADDFHAMEKIICKLSGPFRGHKHFQRLKGLMRHYRHLKALRPVQSIEHFLNGITSLPDAGCVCFSRATFVFLLAQLWTTQQLLAKLINDSVACASLTMQQLELELFVPVNVVILSIASNLVNHFCFALDKTQDLCRQIAVYQLRMKSTTASQQPSQLCETLSAFADDELNCNSCLQAACRVAERLKSLRLNGEDSLLKQNDALAFFQRVLQLDAPIAPSQAIEADFGICALNRCSIESASRLDVAPAFRSRDKPRKVRRQDVKSPQPVVPQKIDAKASTMLSSMALELKAVRTLRDLKTFTLRLEKKAKSLRSTCASRHRTLRSVCVFLKTQLNHLKFAKKTQAKATLKLRFKHVKSEAVRLLNARVK